MKSPLDGLEARFTKIFEGKSILLPWMNEQSDSVTRLLERINDFLKSLLSGGQEIPDKFDIHLSRTDAAHFDGQPELKETAAEVIMELASQYGVNFPKRPTVNFVVKPSLSSGEFEIKPIQVKKTKEKTDSMRSRSAGSSYLAETPSGQASLMLGDEELFYLSSPVINLGRKSDNHIVFDDLRVSRNHAQIRQIYDNYVIFDTGSSGGTYVNGKRITQCTLKTGDVISLAGVKLIFSEEETNVTDPTKETTSKINLPDSGDEK